LFGRFADKFRESLEECVKDPDVAGFKSVVGYRTGLDVSIIPNMAAEAEAVLRGASGLTGLGNNVPLRLADKLLNDWVVRTTVEIATTYGKPGMFTFTFLFVSCACKRRPQLFTRPLLPAVQFHTGLGDADIKLTRASPAHLQPLIEAYPQARFVLLHAGYPYMREAGYLTAMYKNVYLDIGEVFPVVSGHGQEAIIRQVLELAPMNKVMWSSKLCELASSAG
jgi:Amidohydrolase